MLEINLTFIFVGDWIDPLKNYEGLKWLFTRKVILVCVEIHHYLMWGNNFSILFVRLKNIYIVVWAAPNVYRVDKSSRRWCHECNVSMSYVMRRDKDWKKNDVLNECMKNKCLYIFYCLKINKYRHEYD